MLKIVVMGVSGCGKSTMTGAIAQALALDMADGDDFHLPGSIAKMRAGVALDDSDRWPWLDRIGRFLAEPEATAHGRVVACSALKRAYRDRIRVLVPRAHFVFLDGGVDLIRERLALRTGHYMRSDLLASQFTALEKPTTDETDVTTLDIDRPVEQVVADAVKALMALELQPTRQC
ncbi:gluconokinase [Polaromonas sp. YR568]|uniref:gluconokinase n=1 Tax=Polaromonas sp. YR568 TaxID=1855301 RepID=UPI003137E0E5